MKRGKKGEIQWDMVGYIILGVAAAVLLIGGYLYFKGYGVGAVNYIKNLLSFGR